MVKYSKFIASLLGVVFAGIIAARADDGMLSSVEWINVILLLLGAVGVLGAGNLPEGVWKYTKLYVSAATAGLVYLASVLTTGDFTTLTESQWLQCGLAVLSSLGVVFAPGPRVAVITVGRHAKIEE